MNHGLTHAQCALIRLILAPYANRIEGVFLFGSRASGTYRPNSDIDLVLRGDIADAMLDRLHTLFQESALPVAVDVKSYDQTNYPPLKRHMDDVMQLLFAKRDLQTSENANG